MVERDADLTSDEAGGLSLPVGTSTPSSGHFKRQKCGNGIEVWARWLQGGWGFSSISRGTLSSRSLRHSRTGSFPGTLVTL